MTASITHTTTTAEPDSADGKISSNAWNEGHTYSGFPVLLEQHTASSSSSLNFTTCITSSYDVYAIDFVGVYGGGATPCVRMSTNGGSSYDSGGNYDWTQWVVGLGTGNPNTGSDTTFNLANFSDVAPGTSTSISGRLMLYIPAAGYASLIGQIGWGRTADGGFHAAQTLFSGRYDSATAPNAFQFYFSSGNITAGTIRVHGIPK